MVFLGTMLAFVALMLVGSMARAAGCGAAVATAVILGLVGVLYLKAARGCSMPGRPVAEILKELDEQDRREAPEEEYQAFFDELLLHIVTDPNPELEQEIVRRMNSTEAPSRRMFLQPAAVHPNLEPPLRELSESANPLAPEAKELLERRTP